ncbi:CD63 antigen-like [Eurosta solidaginis]|uniref:CD63 antigen-like n=1 Tax=Eurosta solidaginis TaxID=178769 RepID=UPI003530A2B9
MNCFASLVKYAIYIINVVFVLIGILIIVLGSVMIGSLDDYSSVHDVVDVKLLPILIIVLGCIVFLISFLGCCGAIRESSFCMTAYAICMFVLVCLQVSLVVWAFVQRSDLLKTMEEFVKAVYNQNDAANGYPMDVLQVSFQCCGKNSYKDYDNDSVVIPVSCCGSVDIQTCPASIYETKPGCIKEFVGFWSTNMDIIRYAGLVVAAIELGIFIVACCLASSMRKSHHLNH